MIHGPHPLSVALGEVVVDGHDVDAAAGEGVQVGGQGGCKSLALARLHLGDLALVEHDAAHDLDVEVAQTERALGGLADGGEGLGADVVELVAVGQQGLELVGLGPQALVGELFELSLQLANGFNVRTEALEDPVAPPVIRFAMVFSMGHSFRKPGRMCRSLLVYYNERGGMWGGRTRRGLGWDVYQPIWNEGTVCTCYPPQGKRT